MSCAYLVVSATFFKIISIELTLVSLIKMKSGIYEKDL